MRLSVVAYISFAFAYAKGMLVILIRSVIIFTFLVLGMRLMGKRTIGELQPFEFVIVLAVAELACTPMQDLSTPLTYGLVPLFTLCVTHYFVTLCSAKYIRFRKFINGKPVIVVDSDGICSEAIRKLNLNVNDLLEMIRQQGYFSLQEIKYAIIETNGKLSIMENEEAEQPQSIPTTIVMEGKFLGNNAEPLQITKESILKLITDRKLKMKDVLLLTVDSNQVFLQAKNQKYEVFEA